MAVDNKEILNLNKKEKKSEIVEIPSFGGETSKESVTESSQQENKESLDKDIESGESFSGSGERIDPTGVYSRSNDPAYQSFKKIEQIMEEGLGDLYSSMNYREQIIFKTKGEETAKSIFQLVYRKSKINVKKIIKLIRNWLKLIPGVNKFFLEQEAKIKADKIIALAEQDKKIQF